MLGGNGLINRLARHDGAQWSALDFVKVLLKFELRETLHIARFDGRVTRGVVFFRVSMMLSTERTSPEKNLLRHP